VSSDPSGQSLHAIWSTAAPVWGHNAEYIDAQGASVDAMLDATDLVAAGVQGDGSIPVSCHRWSTMFGISPCHLRRDVLRPSYVACFETTSTMGSRLRIVLRRQYQLMPHIGLLSSCVG
jgi:hypothetical protein